MDSHTLWVFMHSPGSGLASWDDLRFFLAAAREGSFAAAGRAIGVDHTTVARRVAGLEERLGARLFDRARDGLRLTGAGETLLERAREIDEAFLAVDRLVGALDDERAGEVVLSTGTVLAEAFVVGGLPRLQAAHPAISLRLQLGRRLVSLPQREADLGLRLRPAGSNAAEGDMVVRKLGDVELGLFGAPAYLRGRPAFETTPGRHVLVRYGGVPWEPGAAWLDARPGATVALVADDMPTVRAACIEGLGLAVLPTFYTRGTKLRRVAASVDAATLSLAVHPDLRRVPRVRAVADWLRDEVRGVLAQTL